MATTQAQRASLFNTLAELMGTEDAETLMQQLPPGGWDSMATKDDIQVLAATFTAALAESSAHAARERAEIVKVISESHAEAARERAEIVKVFSERHSELVMSHAELVKSHAESHAELVMSLAEAAKERAEIIKSHAKHLYITVSTIVLATISIWIALLAGPTGG